MIQDIFTRVESFNHIFVEDDLFQKVYENLPFFKKLANQKPQNKYRVVWSLAETKTQNFIEMAMSKKIKKLWGNSSRSKLLGDINFFEIDKFLSFQTQPAR